MGNLIKTLFSENLITPPRWLPDNVHYVTLMGSQAYGVSVEKSDSDIYSLCIPPREIVFPHTAGYIPGFDTNVPSFNEFQQHGIVRGDKEYDMTVYSIVKYFSLCAGGNPNMVDSLFTPANCILFMTPIGERVREHRKLFLSKKCWHTFKGYAFAQMSKIKSKTNPTSEARKQSVAEHGYDVKYAYHLVRLIQEIEQLLLEGDLDLTRGNETLKAIRKGAWSVDEVLKWFDVKVNELEKLYLTSNTMPHAPPMDEIREVLLQCLEHHYGSLEKVVDRRDKEKNMLVKIQLVLDGKL